MGATRHQTVKVIERNTNPNGQVMIMEFNLIHGADERRLFGFGRALNNN